MYLNCKRAAAGLVLASGLAAAPAYGDNHLKFKPGEDSRFNWATKSFRQSPFVLASILIKLSPKIITTSPSIWKSMNGRGTKSSSCGLWI